MNAPLSGKLRPWAIAVVIAAMAVAGAACSAGGATGTPPDQPTPGPLAEPAHNWTVVSDDLYATFATPDLAVGRQRVALVLSDGIGLISFPIVNISSYYYPGGFDNEAQREGPVETATAHFHEFPLGTRGIHVAHMEFDRVGDWSIEARVPRPDGSISTVEIHFPVASETRSVDAGERPPASRNRTLADTGGDVSALTTGSLHDPDLYRLTVAEALDNGQPLVVVFASPAFCTNAVCGPQVEVASELQETYGGQADFIHVDLYENPQEIQGDLSKAIVTPLLDEWGLISQEWTYVVDHTGTVAARFENFVSKSELEEALMATLADS